MQHGATLGAVVLMLAARGVAHASIAAALVLIAAGLGLFMLSGTVWQRWSIDYKGHRIVVENNPLRGERLLVDGVLAAKGAFGVISHMSATITTPSGPEQIFVRTEARLTWFRCVVTVFRGAVASASDAELLAEVRRRGLT